MLTASPFMLAGAVTKFLENPAWLIGLPLLILGAVGVLIAFSPFDKIRWPEPQQASESAAELVIPPEGHPTPTVYVQVGLFLAVITAIEVAFYYVDLAQGVLLGILLVLSAMKFVVVVLWFMHLRFDNRLLTILFSGGLTLVAVLFVVVLATLGANLV